MLLLLLLLLLLLGDGSSLERACSRRNSNSHADAEGNMQIQSDKKR